jgi:hypothetical protein
MVKQLIKRNKRHSSMQAYLIEIGADGRAERRTLVRVSILITTVPEVPQVVLYDDRAFLLTNTSPLTYSQVLAVRGVKA